MNDTVWTIYREYLDRTGNEAAAASLALADTMRQGLDAGSAASPNRPMTVPEVAKLLRVSPDKVLSWIRSGRLRGYNIAERENGRPKYRVNPDDLQAFTQQRAITQPAPKGRPVGRRRIPVIARPHL
jgi:excisionase family DNA binding protein